MCGRLDGWTVEMVMDLAKKKKTKKQSKADAYKSQNLPIQSKIDTKTGKKN